MRKILKILAMLVLVVLVSCKPQPEDLVPSYLSINSADLQADNLQGTAYSKITDIWVYDGNTLIGAFELPFRCPIIKEGNTAFNFYAGIKMNGIKGTRVPYPFYDVSEQNIELFKDSIVSIDNITFKYHNRSVFQFIEDFESPNNTFEKTNFSNIDIERFSFPELNNLVEGETNNYAAGAKVATDTLFFEWQTVNNYELPTNGRECFLELSYKCNIVFSVGIITQGTAPVQHPILNINPSEAWNKIYVNLTATLSNFSSSKKFKIYFTGRNIGNTNEFSEVYLDNIKLINFPE